MAPPPILTTAQILPELVAEASQMTLKPAFVLEAGDLVSSGSQPAFDAWKSAMSPVYNAGIGVYPVMGNHDVNDVSAFINTFGPSLPDNGPAGEVDRTFSFTYNNALVLGLDTYATPHTVNLPLGGRAIGKPARECPARIHHRT